MKISKFDTKYKRKNGAIPDALLAAIYIITPRLAVENLTFVSLHDYVVPVLKEKV